MGYSARDKARTKHCWGIPYGNEEKQTSSGGMRQVELYLHRYQKRGENNPGEKVEKDHQHQRKNNQQDIRDTTLSLVPHASFSFVINPSEFKVAFRPFYRDDS